MVAVKAEDFSPEAIDAVLKLDFLDNADLLALAVTVVTIFTGMRIQDCVRLYSDNIIKDPHSPADPRHFRLVLEQTKNDIEGTGPAHGLSYYLPCICLSSQSARLNVKFATLCAADPWVPCIVPCPFHIFDEYLCTLPDPYGLEWISLGPHPAGEVTGRPRAFRALTTRGINRYFTRQPLGVNSMRSCLPTVNSRLPDSLKLLHPIGHSGRKTFVSVAINEKVAPEIVCLASKHKDAKTLVGYIAPSPLSLMSASLANVRLMLLEWIFPPKFQIHYQMMMFHHLSICPPTLPLHHLLLTTFTTFLSESKALNITITT